MSILAIALLCVFQAHNSIPQTSQQHTALLIVVQDQVGQELVPGEGTLTVSGDLRPLTNSKANNGPITVSVTGGKIFIVEKRDKNDKVKTCLLKSLAYKSQRWNRTYILSPTGVPNSLSPLCVRKQTTITITIDTQGRATVKVN